jgi:signal transduction histidine kinase
VKTLARAVVLCALYVGAGKLGLSLAFVHASASAVWPSTGIALGAFLVYGARVWPVILVGAFLVNVTTTGSAFTSVAIAAGNTLEGLLGAWLVTRFAGGARFVERARDFITFTVLAGLVATTVSATIGASTLVLSRHAAPDAFDDIVVTWWLGDAVGALVVAPVFVVWVTEPLVRMTVRRWVEASVLLLTIVAIAFVVFGGAWVGIPPRYSATFMVIPPLMWAAFRFGPRGVASVNLVLSAIAVWGTLRGLGPFVLGSAHESLLVLQAFLGTIAVTAFTVVAVVAERRRAQEDAVAATRAKDEFLAVLSHELRTPLNAVVGWTAMLRSGGLDAATTEKALATIERNARHQAQLIEDLLDVSRIVLGQVRLANERVPLAPIVTAAVDSARPAAVAKRVRLAGQVASEVAVSGDPTRIQQIVTNLLSNAIKFTPADEEVTIRLVRAGSMARIEVRDTGKGIAAVFLPHLFERFRQADGSVRRAYGGLGVGLSIVRHLVELHGGSVRAESEGEGQGATFIVELPAARD